MIFTIEHTLFYSNTNIKQLFFYCSLPDRTHLNAKPADANGLDYPERVFLHRLPLPLVVVDRAILVVGLVEAVLQRLVVLELADGAVQGVVGDAEVAAHGAPAAALKQFEINTRQLLFFASVKTAKTI